MKKTIMLFAVLAGCSHAGVNQELTNTLRDRAAFDLNCKRDSLEVTPLQGGTEAETLTMAGVAGCGQRGTYVWNGYLQTWMMNGTGGTPAETSPGTAKQ